jgi:hypothetical protein
LIDALQGIGLRQAGRSRTGEQFLETDAATVRGVMPLDYAQLVRNIDALRNVNVIAGTAQN